MSDRRRVPETELSDSEDEGDNRKDQRSYREKVGVNGTRRVGGGRKEGNANLAGATIGGHVPYFPPESSFVVPHPLENMPPHGHGIFLNIH